MLNVLQFHAEVYFEQELQSYVLVDQGSQNGTVINGNRILQVGIVSQSVKLNRKNLHLNSEYFLLQPKTKCDPHALMHGDEVKMGETVLSFHIHSGTDTCDGCEPGQVMAHLSKHKREEWTAGEEKDRFRYIQETVIKKYFSNPDVKSIPPPSSYDMTWDW